MTSSPDDVLTSGPAGARDVVVMSVANAPGLPPVVAVALVASDGEALAPEGYDLVQVDTQP